MKNIFGYNVRNPELHLDGEEFIIRRIESGLIERRIQTEKEAQNIEKGSHLPAWLRISTMIIAFIGLILLSGGLNALSDGETPLAVMQNNGLWWFIGFGSGGIAIGLIFWLLDVLKQKRARTNPSVDDFTVRAKKLDAQCREDLKVPQDVVEADVFSFPYRIMFGRQVSALLAQYSNNAVHFFREGDMLCIADATLVVGIPFDKIEGVYCVKRAASFLGWTKNIPPKKMKPYKIRVNQYGVCIIKPYYAIKVRGSEPFFILFPAYEFEAISPLCGSKALTVEEVKKLV